MVKPVDPSLLLEMLACRPSGKRTS